MNVLKRGWIPLVIVVVVAIAGLSVYRVHGVFGSNNEITRPGAGLAKDAKPFNPKVVTYEIFGPRAPWQPSTTSTSMRNRSEVKDTALPWSITLTTTAPAASANIVAQGDGDSIGCRIIVNDKVKDEKYVRRRERPDLLPGEVGMTNTHIGAAPDRSRGSSALFSVPILLGWLALTVHRQRRRAPDGSGRRGARGVVDPQRCAVDAGDASASGKYFKEFDSNSSAMVVLEGDQPLGAEAHHYYDGLIPSCRRTPTTSSTSRTSGVIRSPRRGRRAPTARPPTFSCIWPATRARRLANESVEAVRDIVASTTPPPPG